MQRRATLGQTLCCQPRFARWHRRVRPPVAPSNRTDIRVAKRDGTGWRKVGGQGSDPLLRHKGGSTAADRGQQFASVQDRCFMQRRATLGQTLCCDRKGAAQRRKGGSGSLLCRTGVSCSGARHWVRPSVASLASLGGTGGSDPLSHRQTERTSGWRNVTVLGAQGICPDVPPSFAPYSHSTETQGKMLSVCQYEAFYNNHKPEKSFVGVGVM